MLGKQAVVSARSINLQFKGRKEEMKEGNREGGRNLVQEEGQKEG